MPSGRVFKTVLSCLTLIVSVFSVAATEPKVLLELFHQPGCKECDMIKRLVLPRVDERFKDLYELKLFDIAAKENFLRLADYQESLNIQGNEPVTIILQGKVALTGYKAIDRGLVEAIAEAISNREPLLVEPGKPQNNSILSKRSERMTLAAVLCAGFLDGLNPCAFSTLVFFMSLLAVAKVRDGRLFAVGLLYCLASFLTYTLLGFGLFKFIKAITAFHALQTVFNWGMAALLLLMAFMSFRDAWRFSRSGKAEDVSLQLPRRLKLMIHAVMRRGLGYRFLLPGAFAIGVAVTLLESVCTGQVYLPTLALLAKESAETMKWASLILLYNAMFAIPLLFVFAVAFFGVRTPKLLDWSRRNVAPSKILLGLLFLALAAMIFWL